MPDVKLLNMDCMDYMRELPDKSFDLAIVDSTISTHYLRIY